ncbi:MAG: TonB-dependent receptor, partial [Candidatus Dadabacteria bacterium]
MRQPTGWFLAACAAALLCLGGVPAAAGEGSGLAGLSLEELLSTEVTTVSRRAEALSDAAAAVSVITAEDIRRSGATSVPEALRLVPGVQVARIDANKWAVSARGFNGRFANKLLVLVDGRTVYTPLFSGVHWDAQDLLLDDVERIEVIRGPGATLWGANAVNGVINIITRHAKDTVGTRIA